METQEEYYGLEILENGSITLAFPFGTNRCRSYCYLVAVFLGSEIISLKKY